MSIIPPNDPSRGCSSKFSQPLRREDLDEAQNLWETLNRVNGAGNLREIVYRPGDRQSDILQPVFRWDNRGYEYIFTHGFESWQQGDIPNNTYYNLNDFVHRAGAPLNSDRPPNTRHAFVSASLSRSWYPLPSLEVLPLNSQIQTYRYEIYAPGGIWVANTLGDQYEYTSQCEISFVGGIAPQYIRSCCIVTVRRATNPRHSTPNIGSTLIINSNFNPVSVPYRPLEINFPTFYRLIRDEDGRRRRLPLSIETYPPRRERREVLDADKDDAYEWYTTKVVEVASYIDSAFRSSRTNEVYFFMKNNYVRLYYKFGEIDDKILTDLQLICDGFPSLRDTPFGEYGIDCAFNTEDSKAYIFSTNLCAYIDYAPGTKDDKILSGPMTIAAMFPVLKNTVFENGIDSAFRSTQGTEVYLFKDNKYGRIEFDSKQLVGTIRNITDGFTVLKGTIFESGIDACFASHKEGLAYLFKGENYVRINFKPGRTDDTLVGDVKPVLHGWPILKDILPRENKGDDSHFHPGEEDEPPYPDQHEDL